MNSRKFKQILVASALGAATALACAQQGGLAAGASGSLGTTPAAAKVDVDVRGNAALTHETAVTGTPIQGSPGTQSGVAVTHTVAMGASGSYQPAIASQTVAGLSRTQMRALERYDALR